MRWASFRRLWRDRHLDCVRRSSTLSQPNDELRHQFLLVFRPSPDKVWDLNKALEGFLPDTFPHPWPPHVALAPGYHFLYGNSMSAPANLLEDGTEHWHRPDPGFKYRIWAGGHLYFRRRGKPLGLNLPGHCVAMLERTMDIKTKSDGRTAFVKIRRTLVGVRPGHRRTLGDGYQIAELLPKDLEMPRGNWHPSVMEDRWIVFSKDKPGERMKVADEKTSLCPGDADFEWSITPNAALLFRISALTNNAHAIHLDPEYTKQVYGLPALVVHGPLTVILMLQVLSYALRQQENKVGLVRGQLRIESMSYNNLAPLYVNQEMKISCRKIDGGDGLNDHQMWDVWISKELRKGDEEWRVAVKAKVQVYVQHEMQARWYYNLPDSSNAHWSTRTGFIT